MPRQERAIAEPGSPICTARDGVRIAYGVAGSGPPLVYPATSLNNLLLDPTLPGYKHWLEGLSLHHTLIWADLRGAAMSDRDVPSMEFEDWVGDLEVMIGDLGLTRFPLFGLSHGAATCIAYAVRHPERVSHLVLHAPYLGGFKRYLSEKGRSKWEAYRHMLREYWDADTQQARRFFADAVEFASPEAIEANDELRRVTISPEMLLQANDVMADLDTADLLPRICVPTLATHPRDENLVPQKESRRVAAATPGARLLVVDAKNHVVQEDEPGWPVLLHEIWKFLGVDETGTAADESLERSPLSAREREVLTLVAAGKTDAQIATALSIAPATASRHVHNILTKLGASNRAEAVGLAAEKSRSPAAK